MIKSRKKCRKSLTFNTFLIFHRYIVRERRFQHKAFLRVKNTTQDSIELIYELSRKVYQTSTKNNKTISERIYEIGEVDYVNIITQNDEIS